MSSKNKYEVSCHRCGKKFKALLYDSINITLDPQLMGKIFDGKINLATCPRCKTKAPVSKSILFHDMDKNLMIGFQCGFTDIDLKYFAKELYVKEYAEFLKKKKDKT